MTSAYDPHAPLRNPLSRRSNAACLDDMIDRLEAIALEHGADAVVTEDDLVRAGFTPGEIDRHRAEAVARLAKRLDPARRAA